ncbi:hypothetical protein QE152_g40313 [Popillia japonica]|uniref:Uncharacterized protein n=1 Tax=Popillia japonica TaxID=7064 RepID=A0AAW1HRK2_POPJA
MTARPKKNQEMTQPSTSAINTENGFNALSFTEDNDMNFETEEEENANQSSTKPAADNRANTNRIDGVPAPPKTSNARNISLNEALEMVENDEEFQSQVNTITIFPPSTNSGYHTDEDSGDEDLVHINNLSGAQLRAPTEINLRLTTPVSEDDYSSEDHISLQMLIKRKIKTPSTQKNLRVKKKHYEWIQQDLSTNGTVFWH